MINKDKLKGFLAGLSTAIILCSTAAFAESIEKTVTAFYNNIKIVIDGKEITPSDANGKVVEPFIIDGTTYLPVRAVASALGEEVNWDGETNTVYIGDMPQKKDEFEVDASTLSEFSDKNLLSVDSTSVSGGIFNLYVTQNATDQYMQALADNYSADANLQTLTVNSTPVAKYLTEQICESVKLVFATYNDAEKTGFLKEASTVEAIEKEWGIFRSRFATEEEYNTYLKKNSISDSDIKKLMNATTVFNLYGNSIYEANKQKEYDTVAYEASLRKNYITAKHILVEDEQLAKKIIAGLDKGEDFDALMAEHNIDPGATEDGYTFTYGQMVEPFEAAAYALKENTYTKEPVKTDYGYHIIYRCVLSDKAVAEYVATYIESLASSATNDYLSQICENAAVTYTADYKEYITTIK